MMSVDNMVSRAQLKIFSVARQDIFLASRAFGKAKKQLLPALLTATVAENRPLKLNRRISLRHLIERELFDVQCDGND